MGENVMFWALVVVGLALLLLAYAYHNKDGRR